MGDVAEEILKTLTSNICILIKIETNMKQAKKNYYAHLQPIMTVSKVTIFIQFLFLNLDNICNTVIL